MIKQSQEKWANKLSSIETNPASFAFMIRASNQVNMASDSQDVLAFILDSGATDHIINRDDV